MRDYNRFLQALAIRTGTILTLSNIANDVGVSPNTIKSWLYILQGSELIFLLEPYYRNLKKRLVKTPKIYFTDTGLVTNLLGFESWQDIIRPPIAGAIWETYVFTQLLKYFLNKGIFPPIWFWRTKDGEEVDFIIDNLNGEKHITIDNGLNFEKILTENSSQNLELP